MTRKAQWKQPDGEGGYDVMHHETSAEMVKYGGGTVKDFLDASASSSLFVRALATAEDEFTARTVLQVSKENYFDECGDRWSPTGAMLSEDQKKFGSTSLYLNGSTSYLKRVQNVTLGGKDFTIACWVYSAAGTPSSNHIFFCWGDSDNRFGVCRTSANKLAWFATTGGTSQWAAADWTETFPTSEWIHVEIDYRNSDKKMFLFINGVLKNTQTISALGTAMTNLFYIGTGGHNTALAFKGYVDEFLIIEKLLHTAAFTPPTAPYAVDDKNIALLHFGIDKVQDETGAIWYNNAASFFTTQKKFGTKSLYVNDTFLQRVSKLKLGGKDFTIACWVYSTAGTPSGRNQVFFCWGDSSNRFGLCRNTSNLIAWFAAAGGTSQWAAADMASPLTFTTGAWIHVEIGYRNSDKKMFLFVNGVLNDTQTFSALGTAMNLPFYISNAGHNTTLTFNGYIDEFIITEELLHDADFTPPTEPYSVDGKTLAHFSFE